MTNLTVNTISNNRGGAWLFMIAGSLMLINTAFLWARLLSGGQLSLLWAAIPAITAFACAIWGLFKLYPQAAVNAPRVAKAGAGFALLACGALMLAALWIFAVSVFGGGMPVPPPPAMLGLIALFVVAMVIAFLSNAIAFLRHDTQRKVGYLLTVPLAMWTLMLVVGLTNGTQVGLSLDFYTNGVIALAFLGLGFTLKNKSRSDN